MIDITMGQGDTLPSLRTILRLGADPVNLTGATVEFLFLPIGGGPSKGGLCVINDPLTADVQYDWAAGDTASAGVYNAKFEATFPGGKKMSFPNRGYRRLEITADIAEPTGP